MEKKKGAFRTSIGGQALIEGILMRGPEKDAIVVRSPEGLVTKVTQRKFVKANYPILGVPILRGAVTFISSMITGVKALMFSADYFPDDENAEPGKLDKWLDEHIPADKLQSLIVAFSVVLSIGLMLVLFMLLPTFIAGLFHATSPAVHNLIEGVVKIAVLLTYMILCSEQKDVYRVFCYHGAEHKTIFCYEAGLPLTVENVRIQPRHHPRCGTSFLFVVVIVSIIVSSLVFPYINWQSIWVRVGVKLLLLVPVVGVTYEFNRLVGAHDNVVTRILSAPGMWLQNFTTHEPDDSMIEVAIEAMKLVILPQAVKNILPALGNEFVTIIKESSIVSVIGIADLMYRAKGVIAKTYNSLECLAIAAIMYFILTFIGGRLIALMERKMAHGRK